MAGTPMDVVEFVEFCYSGQEKLIDVLAANSKTSKEKLKKLHPLDMVFRIIDGEDGNGEISLREFEEGIEEMSCKKFDPKDKTDPPKSTRISSVFRYLDPSGEGTVSKDEWGVLKQLWNEINLSIKEFVDFCERTFEGDLSAAWKLLDADESGAID